MKLPRFSIAWVMTIIIVAALDFAVIRAFLGMESDIGVLMVVGAMPMASLLLLGIPSLAWKFSGRGKPHPFLIGFEAVGWPTVLFYTVSTILFPGSLAEDIVAVMLWLPIDFNTPFWKSWWASAGCEAFLLLMPQLVPALIGGWLTQRFEIRISIRRRTTDPHPQIRPSDACEVVPSILTV